MASGGGNRGKARRRFDAQLPAWRARWADRNDPPRLWHVCFTIHNSGVIVICTAFNGTRGSSGCGAAGNIINGCISSLKNGSAFLLPGPKFSDQSVLWWALKHFGIGHGRGTAEENIINSALPFERGNDICRVLCVTCQFVSFRFGQVCALLLVLSRNIEGAAGTWRISVLDIGARPSKAIMIAPFRSLVQFRL